MAQLPVSFSVDSSSNHLIAAVTGSGDGGVENGLSAISQPFTIDGVGNVDLGLASASVSSFQFTLGGDSADFVVYIAADLTLTVISADGQIGQTGPTPPTDLLQRFWGGMTQPVLTAALQGALSDWIVANAVGLPVLAVVGFVSGGGAFLVAALAKGSDLVAIFLQQVASQEVANGIISSDEAAQIKQWARVGDALMQLPAIAADESELSQMAAILSGTVQLDAESDTAKLTASLAADGVAKYTFALQVLAK